MHWFCSEKIEEEEEKEVEVQLRTRDNLVLRALFQIGEESRVKYPRKMASWSNKLNSKLKKDLEKQINWRLKILRRLSGIFKLYGTRHDLPCSSLLERKIEILGRTRPNQDGVSLSLQGTGLQETVGTKLDGWDKSYKMIVKLNPCGVSQTVFYDWVHLKGQYRAIFSNTLKIGKTLFGW